MGDKPKALIVDDSFFMRTILKNIFTNAGFEVVGEAENGDEGVKLYKELKPDIVTMDIIMPGKDGIAALQEIIVFDKNARIIMATAMGQQKFVIKAIDSGARDFIIKPFKPKKVIDAVRAILK